MSKEPNVPLKTVTVKLANSSGSKIIVHGKKFNVSYKEVLNKEEIFGPITIESTEEVPVELEIDIQYTFSLSRRNISASFSETFKATKEIDLAQKFI